ncbi:conserved Plasmodium protein, unknown function [Plasmodium vinckei brucechwatti]|uniref:Uncharacterized protein n=1 Tax=Plasmodium vinckei brucechwatti TaxID=119398 RepID=A0A6V7RYE4_PLAVN|nr:conserved Plasmodium protein, unknown function [Plasmodium vinckei brucechwatti]
MDSYSFLNKNNYKVIIQIVTNYINLEQYELARLLLANLVKSNLLNITDLKKDKKITNKSIKKKLYILKKVLKYIRRYIEYGSSPLQIFSNEISSSHFLLKLMNDYNDFVDLIFLNFLTFEKNYKTIFSKFKQIYSDPQTDKCKQPNETYNIKSKYNSLARFKYILKNKYISNKIKQKIQFDTILSIIIVHKEHYLKICKNLNFDFFTLDVLQYLRRLFYLYIKTRELFKKNKINKIKNRKKYNNDLLIYLLDYVIPYNNKQTKIQIEKNRKNKNRDFAKTIFNEKKYKINYNDNFFNKIDELTIKNFKLIYETDGDTPSINIRKKKQNNNTSNIVVSKTNLNKSTIKTHNINIIYIPPLYIINQKPIHNYIVSYDEELSFFFERNIVLEIFIDLFYLCFYLPYLSVSLFKALFFNRKYFHFLLQLFMLTNRVQPKSIENKKSSNSNAYSEKPSNQASETNTQNNIHKSYLIFLEAYLNTVHIYITVLVEKLKKNNLVDYQNFIYLFKYNHLFINNIFLFSLCSTITYLHKNYQENLTEISSKDNSNSRISNDVHKVTLIRGPECISAFTKVDIKNGKTKMYENFPYILKQFRLATDTMNKLYNFLVMLVFYYNCEDENVLLYFSSACQTDNEKGEYIWGDGNMYDYQNEVHMVELDGVALCLCINHLKIQKIIDLYISKLKNKTVHIYKSKNGRYITYKNKCIIYEILISTNTFYSNRTNQIYNIFIYLFNYIDDIYLKNINEEIVCYPIETEKNEDLLFYINYSKIYNTHFLSYLFRICQNHLTQNNFDYLNQILNNFKKLKNLCILYCLENTNDIGIKLKCLSELKMCKYNKYLYNYIKDIKIKIHIACVNYYFYKSYEHILKLFKTNKLTKSDIYTMLTSCSIPHFLNKTNILPYVNTIFVIKLKKYIKKLFFYKKKNYMDLNMIMFYLAIKSSYGYLSGTTPLQDIKKNYKLIQYKECKIKCLFYFTIIVFRFTENKHIEPPNFIKFVLFIYNKLRQVNPKQKQKQKQIISPFFFNLRNLLLKVFENVYTRLTIFIIKSRMNKSVKKQKAICNDKKCKNNSTSFGNIKQNYQVKIFENLSIWPPKYRNKFMLIKISRSKKSRNSLFFSSLTKIEKRIQDKEYIYYCFKKSARKNKFKKKEINNILDKYIYDIIYNTPQEYIYKNIINQKGRSINMFILYKYKKQLTKFIYTYNLILYLKFVRVFKKLYIKNVFSDSIFINNPFSCQVLNKSKHVYHKRFDLFHLISYYINKYKDNEINMYILRNNYNANFLLVYIFLGICVTHSYKVENGILLLKFAKIEVKKMKKTIEKVYKSGNLQKSIDSNETKNNHLILKFLLYFIKKLHILLEIKKNISKSKLMKNRGYKDKYMCDEQTNPNLSCKKKETKMKNKRKNILLIKYLLLTSNSLKIQSKLIKKYFIDLYKKKNFLQDMFFFFSNLKKKKKVILKLENSQIDKENCSTFTKDSNIFIKNKTKYQHTSYKDMHIILEKYSTLLIQNIDEQKGSTINYLLYFFFFSNILITYIYDALKESKIDANFFEYASKNGTSHKNIYSIRYQTKINYNLFHIFTIDIYTIVKYILFIANSYVNAKVLCSLFFIQYYQLLVENLQTQFFIKDELFSDKIQNVESADTHLGSIDLFPSMQSTEHIKYKLKCKNIYINKKPMMQYLTSDFLFLINDINIIKIIEKNINLAIKKNKITNMLRFYKSYITYIINKIENKEIIMCMNNSVSTKLNYSQTKYDNSNISNSKKNGIMNIFICLDKCDYYFPFCFNILYAYHFSREYTILNRYIKEQYNNINKIFKIIKKNNKNNNNNIIIELDAELFRDIYFIKYHDLFNFNNFTKSILFSSLFDNQRYADCLDICDKSNQPYQPDMIKKYYSNLFHNFNKPNLDANKRKKNLRFWFECILQTDVPADVKIDIFVNKIMKNYKNLELFCFHELMIALNLCLYNEQSQNSDSKSSTHLYIVNCENIDNLPNNIDVNLAKLDTYKHIFKIIQHAKKVHKLCLSYVNPPTKFNFVNVYVSILKKRESKVELLDFISTYKLFKYCEFLLNFKAFPDKEKSEIRMKSTSEYILDLCGLNKGVDTMIESSSCKIMKKNKIILFLKKLTVQNFQNIISYIFYKNKPSILTNLLYFLFIYFKYPYIKKFYVLSLFAKYMKIENIFKKNVKKVYKNIIPLLIQNNKIELAEYIISQNLFTPKMYKIYYSAFLNININLNKINKSMVDKNSSSIKKNNLQQTQKGNIYNIQKCIDILKLSTICQQDKNNIQFVYSIFLHIIQQLFDKICENLQNNIYNTTDTKENSIKLKPNHFENEKKDKIKYTQNVNFQKKHSLFNKFYKNSIYRHTEKAKKHKQTKNSMIRKYYIIEGYTTNIGSSEKLEISNSSNYISNHGRHTKENKKSKSIINTDKNCDNHISTNILIYIFYKICFFFYENYKELKSASNLVCNLLPILIYIKISINLNIKMKNIIKMNIENLINALKKQNYNICNYLIHRIYSCYFYNINTFHVLNEQDLFYSLSKQKEISKKNRIIKNLVSLIYRCKLLPNCAENISLTSLEKIKRFYIFNYEHAIYIYRNNNINKILYNNSMNMQNENKYIKIKNIHNSFYFDEHNVYNFQNENKQIKTTGDKISNIETASDPIFMNNAGVDRVNLCNIIKKTKNKFKVMNKERIHKIIQNLRFNIVSFHYELLNKNNIHFYSTLSLFCFFFFDFHFCNNIYKNYKRLSSYFNKYTFMEQNNIKNTEYTITNNSNIKQIEIFKEIKNQERNYRKKTYSKNFSSYKNNDLINHENIYKIVTQTGGYSYLSYIVLTNSEFDKIKKERKKKNIRQNILKYLTTDNVNYSSCFQIKRNKELFAFPKCKSKNNVIYTNLLNNEQKYIYSFSTPIYINRHILNEITFNYLYNYYNNIFFKAKDSDIEKVNKFSHKKLFIYLIEIIKNPYVINYNEHYFENAENHSYNQGGELIPTPYLRNYCLSIFKKKSKINNNTSTTNFMNKSKKKDNFSPSKKNNKLKIKKLASLKTTFIYSNYIRQKKITQITNMFKNKLEIFQRYIILMHNNSLEKNIMQFFISKQVIDYYEYLFYDINNCSYPLCYINPSDNLNIISQYFKSDINQISEDIIYCENKKYVNNKINANKIKIYLFITSLLLPLDSRSLKLTNYNNSKYYDNFIRSLKDYCSLHNLMNLYTKYDLSKSCLKLLIKNELLSEYFIRIVQRAHKYNYIYKIFQNVSNLRNPLLQHKIKCYLLKKKMYNLLYNYVIFSSDYLNAAIISIYHYSIAQNIDAKNGHLNNALVNLTLIVKGLESSTNYKNSNRNIFYDNFILRNNSNRKKKNRQLYNKSNFNILFDETKKRTNNTIPIELIFRYIDLIIIQQQLLQENLEIHGNIINSKKIDIIFCINLLIYKKIYNLADKIINTYQFNYIFTYCLACMFCLLIDQNLSFIHNIMDYIKIKLNNNDINIFVLHIIYLYLGYRRKFKPIYESIQEMHEKEVEPKTTELNNSSPNISSMCAEKCDKTNIVASQISEYDTNMNILPEHVNNILTYITDNDFLFYSHVLIYIHNKKEYKNLFKHIKNILFTNIKKNDIYKMIICAYKYISSNKKQNNTNLSLSNKKSNYNFIHNNLSYLKNKKINKISIKQFGDIHQDHNFSTLMSLAKQYPDSIKNKISTEILSIYKNCSIS